MDGGSQGFIDVLPGKYNSNGFASKLVHIIFSTLKDSGVPVRCWADEHPFKEPSGKVGERPYDCGACSYYAVKSCNFSKDILVEPYDTKEGSERIYGYRNGPMICVEILTEGGLKISYHLQEGQAENFLNHMKALIG